MSSRPVLSLADIDAFDPQGPASRKWCPLCGDAKPKDAAHRCLSVERSSGLWKCFRCGESGQASEFWKQKPASPSRQTQRDALRAAFGVSNSALKPITAPQRAVSPSGDHLPPIEWERRWNSAQSLQNTLGAAYLARRGIDSLSCELAEVRWSPNWSGHPAVVFPIRARGGETVAAQARAVSGDAKLTAGPKKQGAFFASVQMGSGRICGPLDEAVPAVILVEAPIDALSLAVCGFPALALCGTSGPDWLRLACGLRRVALGFDADDAGDKAAQEMEQLLRPFGARCERLRPPNSKDWNEELLQSETENLKDWLAVALMSS